MRSVGLRSAAIVAMALALGACREHAPEASLAPPDYSPHYTRMKVVTEDGRVKKVVVPDACLTPDDASPADSGPQRLPPGCANNYNLQRMAERERDLTQGRRLAPAPAAPAARAAQRYIDGREAPVLGGGVRDDEGKSTASASSSGSQ